MDKNDLNKLVDTDSQVLLHFSVALPDGTLSEGTRTAASANDGETDSESDKPALFDMRSEHIAPTLKAELMGLKAGDKKQFKLPGDDVFGAATDDNVHFFERHQFPSDLTLSEGAVIAFDQPNGESVPGIVKAIEGNSIKVDFNHPFAGKTVVFDIEVVAVH